MLWHSVSLPHNLPVSCLCFIGPFHVSLIQADTVQPQGLCTFNFLSQTFLKQKEPLDDGGQSRRAGCGLTLCPLGIKGKSDNASLKHWDCNSLGHAI